MLVTSFTDVRYCTFFKPAGAGAFSLSNRLWEQGWANIILNFVQCIMYFKQHGYVFTLINDSSPHQSSQKVKRTHTKLLWKNGFRVKWYFYSLADPRLIALRSSFCGRIYKTRYSHARQGDNPLLLTRTVS